MSEREELVAAYVEARKQYVQAGDKQREAYDRWEAANEALRQHDKETGQ